MIQQEKNTNCYIVKINKEINSIKDSLYNEFQILDDITDDLKIIDSNENEIDIDQFNEIVLLNNKNDTNLFSYAQLSIITKLEKLTDITYLTNVNIAYWI